MALIVLHLTAKRLTGSAQSVHKETRHTGSRTGQLIARPKIDDAFESR